MIILKLCIILVSEIIIYIASICIFDVACATKGVVLNCVIHTSFIILRVVSARNGESAHEHVLSTSE